MVSEKMKESPHEALEPVSLLTLDLCCSAFIDPAQRTMNGSCFPIICTFFKSRAAFACTTSVMGAMVRAKQGGTTCLVRP